MLKTKLDKINVAGLSNQAIINKTFIYEHSFGFRIFGKIIRNIEIPTFFNCLPGMLLKIDHLLRFIFLVCIVKCGKRWEKAAREVVLTVAGSWWPVAGYRAEASLVALPLFLFGPQITQINTDYFISSAAKSHEGWKGTSWWMPGAPERSDSSNHQIGVIAD